MLAIIGGSGWSELDGFLYEREVAQETDYGLASAPLTIGCFAGQSVAFLPRHGSKHQFPPHRVNYRANIQLLRRAGTTAVLAINAVGAIHSAMAPGTLIVPDQIIDYTWGREHTFYDQQVEHIDFTQPFAGPLRDRLLAACLTTGVPVHAGGVYGCVQGPRLETAAEIQRMRRDGCDLVGMTAMPEAALAREVGLDYASLCIAVNWAAGLSDEPIAMSGILALLDQARPPIARVIGALLVATVSPAG